MRLIVYCPTNKDAFEAVANFMSRDPELFVKEEVLQKLQQCLLDRVGESGVLKCLAIIIPYSQVLELSGLYSLLPIIQSIVLRESNDEETSTYAIMALKNCLLSQKSFHDDLVPWKALITTFIEKSYTKKNALLQQVSIQALRIISDKPDVKDDLRKIYKIKIRNIPCLSEESAKLKNDLLQWINYRNYKPDGSSKYAKLFI